MDGTDESVGPGEQPRSQARRAVRWVDRALSVVLLIVVALAAWPVSLAGLGSDPDPAASFDDALDRFAAIEEDESDGIFEPCRSELLHHGEPTDVVVVLFHGLTNCPRQYREMGAEIHAQGANVLILRAPGHGVANASGDAIGGAGALRVMSAESLTQYADDAVDIAAGLGEEVRVSGLSMGGVISMWVAQHRGDVDQVVAVAPAMELPAGPNTVSTLFTNLFSRIPTISISHERHVDHDYAAESTGGLAEMFRLGQAVAHEGLDEPAAVDDITVLLNPDDPLVSETDVEELIEAWIDAGSAIDVVLFPAVGLRHDLVDVGQPNAQPDIAYPPILDALGFDPTWPPR